MSDNPTPERPKGEIVRGEGGKFAPGTCGGTGNPNAKKVAAWRQALVDAVTAEDLEAIIRQLVVTARAGDPWAVREILDRCLGKAVAQVELSTAAGFGTLKTYINVDTARVCGLDIADAENDAEAAEAAVALPSAETAE